MEQEQAFENKERTVYLSSTGDFVKTDLTNPREIKYAAEIQLANKARDKFYGLKPIPQDREEITRAAIDSERGYLKQAAAGVGSAAVSMGQNLWNWARYTNPMLIAKTKRLFQKRGLDVQKKYNVIGEDEYKRQLENINAEYRGVRDIINGEMLANREKQNAYLEKTGLAKREGDSLVYDIANGVGSAAAALGLAIVTKSPNAAALMFGGVAGQSGYEEALAAGIEPEKAFKVGLARGFFEGTLEKIGIHCYIEGLATRGVFARIAKNAAVEAVQEISQQTAEEILQTKYGGRAADWKRATEDILLSGFVGMIVGGGFASVGAGQSILEEQKAKDTGARPLPKQEAQNIDLTDAFESGVKRFTDLGMPVKDAENLTFSLLKKAAEPETAKEIVDMIKEENSNLTYINNDEDQNAAAVAEAIKAATAPERVVKQQAFDIADKVEEQALKAGRTPEEAAASAELAQKASMGLYNLTGVLPQDQYEINIALEQDGLDASENGLTGQEDISFDFGENQKIFQEGIKYDDNGKADINTPEFKNWFGDSKVVAENGEPLVVYHGTESNFDIFDMSKGRKNMDIQGAFFSPWELDAKGYGRNVGAYYLSIKNPANEATGYAALRRFQGQNEAGKKAKEYLQSLGYDGVINNNEEYIAFEPTQIKSVYNKGTFDPKNPNIFYQGENVKAITDKYTEMEKKLRTPEKISREMDVIEELERDNLEQKIKERTKEILQSEGEDYANREQEKKIEEIKNAKTNKEIADILGYMDVEDLENVLREYNADNFAKNKEAAIKFIEEDNDEYSMLVEKYSNDRENYFTAKQKAERELDNISDLFLKLGEERELFFANRENVITEIAESMGWKVVPSEKRVGRFTGQSNSSDSRYLRMSKGEERVKIRLSDHPDISIKGPNDSDITLYYGDTIEKNVKDFISFVNKKTNQTFYQEPNAPRGSVTFADDIKQAFVRFNETADKSTLVHELGHIWLKNIEKFADYAKNPEFAEFKQNLDAWLGAPVNGVYTVEQQEKFAKTFERYLQEGKAPNAELESIFYKFKEWLTEIYNAIKDYIELTPEAIKTFDTLLAPEKSKYNIDKIKSKTAQAKAVVEKIKQGKAVSIDGVTVQDIKEALKVMNSRIPAEPKENLLRTLRSKGADYANAGKIDKEAYKNARVPNKKDGIQDGLALTLRDWGYMDFDDSAVADYEGLSEQDEKAADLIDRALGGEKIYKVNDPQATKREEFLADVEKAREVLGENGEEVARAINTLEKKGYRVVEKADIAYLEKQLDQLDKVVEKARILEQNTEEQKKTEAFEKMQKQNALEARRIKTATLEELNKRDIAGKEKMFEDLQNAETPEEIFTAAADILTELEKEFAKTEEGQAEQRKIDVPATNWEAKKVTLLKDIAEISASASKEEQQARDIINEEHLAKQGLRSALSKEERAELEKARNLLKKSFEKKYLKAFNDALRDEPHIESKDVASIMKVLANNAMEMRLVSNMAVNQFIDIAQRKQEANYKKYMKGKIKDILDLNLFDKQGNLRKALVDEETLGVLNKLKHVSHLNKERAAAELIERMQEFSGKEEAVSNGDKIINELLSIKAHDDKDISVQLFKKTYDDIRELRQAGRSAKNLQKFIMNYRTEQAKQNLYDAVNKNKKGGLLKKIYAYSLANWESMVNLVADEENKERYSMLNEEADALTYSWQRRSEIMDGLKRIYNLGNNREVQNKMNELRNEKYTFTNYAEVDKNPDPNALVRRAGEPFKEELSKMQIITAYIYSKNDALEARLFNQYGQDQLEDMWSKLDTQDKLLANFLQKEAEKTYEKINEVFVKERGYDLPKVENYFPSVTERVESELDFLQSCWAQNKNPAFIKMRADSALIQMKLENPFGILFRHIDRAADYHYKAEKLNQIRRVFKSRMIKRQITEKFGEDTYKKLTELIDQMGVGRQTLKYDIDKLGDWLTNNYVKGAIALKPTIAIKQLISSMNYAEQMPADKWIKGFTDAIMHPKQTIDFMMNGDPYLKARYESGSMNEALARATADADAITARGKFLRFTDLLTINTRLGDIGAIIFGGKPYVDYLMNEKGMSKEDAFAEFRKSTLRSQQSNTRSSLSTLQAHDMNWLLRGLFAFKNTPAQYARKIADGISQYQRGEIDAKQLGKVVAIYGLLNSWMYSMLTTLGLLAWFFDRDEAKELMTDELVFSPFTQMASSLPVLDMAVGQAANVAKAKMFKHKVQLERPEMPVVSDIFKMGSKALKEDVTAEDVLDMLVTGGQVFGGLPTKYAKGIVTGTAATVSGKNPMRGFLQALGYTENRAGKITGEEKKKKKKRRK